MLRRPTTALLLLLVFSIVSAGSLFSQTTVYVHPTTGADSNPGTLSAPFRTIAKAITSIPGGGIIYLRGGTYAITGATRLTLSAVGTAASRYRLWAYPGEVPVIDFSGQNNFGNIYLGGIELSGQYWHLKGIHEQNNLSREGCILTGSNNIVENCSFRRNGLNAEGDGLMLYGRSDAPANAHDNLILNCDSYDNFSGSGNGGNSDGFGIVYNIGPGNVFRGCRAWNNSDDGFDCWASTSPVVFDSCSSFGNGLASGNGQGFKMGGNNTGTQSAAHIWRNCLSANNKTHGFDQNGNRAGQTLYNCTSYGNRGANYNLSTAPTSGAHVIKNCVSYLPGMSNSIQTPNTQTTNSWQGFTVSASDFVSVDSTGEAGRPRNADGALPTSNFLRLATGSDLLAAGTNVGIPFSGSKPDVGAFGIPKTANPTPPPPSTSSFLVYREFSFTGQPAASYFDGLGLKSTRKVSEGQVTGTSSPRKLQQTLMISTARQTKASYPLTESRMWYNIGLLSCDSFSVGKAQAIANADTLAKYIGYAQAAEPTLQIGLCGNVPATDIYLWNRLGQRQSANNLVQRLADKLQFLSPRIYLYYSEQTLAYAKYAVPMIQEAKRMAKGKKVFAVIAPGYHPAGNLDNRYASKAVWANVLRTIKNAGANGVIILAGNGVMGAHPGAWSYIDTCGWWQATKEFLTTLSTTSANIVPTTPMITAPEQGSETSSTAFHLSWIPSEGASLYQVQLAGDSLFASVEFDDSTITTASHEVTLAQGNAHYYGRVRGQSHGAAWSDRSPVNDFRTGIVSTSTSSDGDPGAVPTSFALAQNYPNPFNPATTIRFSLPVAVHVKLIIYNNLGQEVERLVDDNREAGYHETRFDGAGLASGAYYCRIQAGNFVDTKKIVLVK